MEAEAIQKGIFLAAVIAFTLTAAITDFRSRRIPNPLVISAFVLGIIFRGWFDGWSALGDASAAFAIGFGTLFVVWIAGGGGAGDAKLMGALAVWLGYQLTWQVLVVSVVLVSIYSMVEKRRLRRLADPPSGTDMEGKAAATAVAPVPELTGAAADVGGSHGHASAKLKIPFAIPVAIATWLAIGLDLAGMRPPIP